MGLLNWLFRRKQTLPDVAPSGPPAELRGGEPKELRRTPCPRCQYAFAYNTNTGTCGHCGYPEARALAMVPWASADSPTPASRATPEPFQESTGSRDRHTTSQGFKMFLTSESTQLHDPTVLRSQRIIIPAAPGAYGWYFDDAADFVPSGDWIRRNGWTLLYVGITGDSADRWLANRIMDCHLGGTACNSTMRLSLGCLLSRSLGLKLRRAGEKSFDFGYDGEKVLTRWITTHARVAWITTPTPADIESEALSNEGHRLLLNIKKNKLNPFRAELKRVRRDAKAAAEHC